MNGDQDMVDVVIVGGGLAGCSAAVTLAQNGRTVLVLEKGRMPRDKLCGEFLSTEVSELCKRLGILARLIRAGAREITRVYVTSAAGTVLKQQLPGTALGVSRRTLDAALFRRAGEAGAVMRQECTVRSVEGGLGHGFTVAYDGGSVRCRLAFGAYGRRDTLDRRLARPFLRERSPYVAFKAHFVGNDLGNRIELHLFRGGYCGLLMEDHRAVNACWIAHEDELKRAGGSPDGMIDGTFRANRHLAERFDRLERIGDYHAASQLSFRRKSLFAGDVCMIGDAAGMIAPLCGDGMAMAIESGTLAAGLAADFLDRRIDAAGFRSAYASGWKSRFTRRMHLGRLLHGAFVRPFVADAGLRVGRMLPPAARAVIRATRG